jgi:hypothetical protein
VLKPYPIIPSCIQSSFIPQYTSPHHAYWGVGNGGFTLK